MPTLTALSVCQSSSSRQLRTCIWPWLLYMYARIKRKYVHVHVFVVSPFPSSSTGPGGVWQEWCGPAPAGEDGRGLPVRRRAGRGRAHPQPGPCQAQQGRQGAAEYIVQSGLLYLCVCVCVCGGGGAFKYSPCPLA